LIHVQPRRTNEVAWRPERYGIPAKGKPGKPLYQDGGILFIQFNGWAEILFSQEGVRVDKLCVCSGQGQTDRRSIKSVSEMEAEPGRRKACATMSSSCRGLRVNHHDRVCGCPRRAPTDQCQPRGGMYKLPVTEAMAAMQIHGDSTINTASSPTRILRKNQSCQEHKHHFRLLYSVFIFPRVPPLATAFSGLIMCVSFFASS